ncbi:MAG TPA: TonB-dependent receptor [Bryobacteraceae bacterium]|nr:TonB-dependent receptor [Bryobacteraceae bacterium]
MNKTKTLSCLVALLAALAITPSYGQAGEEEGSMIVGAVFDAANGQPVRGAKVFVKDQPSIATVTDTDGQYRLSVPPGQYTLAIQAANYLDTAIEAVDAKPGEPVQASTVMAAVGSVTTVEVVEKAGAATATAEAMLAERKLAPVISDTLSNEEIKKSTASDAAAVLEKVTGVSVVQGGYVYVRGLGERYSATMLNNALLPTTEPERRVVPLDLFPASLIDNIKVLKTYTPDLPGEFAGGLVQMQTVDFPSARMFRVSVSTGFNSRTSFDRFGTYPGGGSDFFGFDDGSRSIPSSIPADRLFQGSFSDEEFQAFGRSFPDNWESRPIDSMRPSQTYTVAGGDTFGRVGLVGALTFSNKPQRIQEMQRYLTNSGNGNPVILTEYPDYTSNMESARLGGVLNAAIRITPANKLVFRNLLTRDSDKEARVFSGYNGGTDTYIQAERLRWIERGLYSSSVEGEHAVQRLGNSLFHWQFTFSSSTRDEPDLREVVRGRMDDGSYAFLALNESGLRFYNGLKDRIYEPQAEWGKPFFAGRVSGMLKVGFRGTFRTRDFWARRFRFIPNRVITLDLLAPSNELFGPSDIRPDGFQVLEYTRGTDTYDADMDVYGGFAMVDLSLGPRWRLIGGTRIEDASVNVHTIDPRVPGAVPTTAALNNRDALPSINLIYALTPRQNLRFGYGRTLSRPDFRELSPFEFLNVLGGFSVIGNPNLKRASIDNFDARWEWFRGGDELFAVSYFYKDFTDPIEVTIRPTTGDLRESFLNAKAARNQGVELEFRKNLGSLSRTLAQFNVHSNFTVVDSNVKIPDGQDLLLTSRQRPLVGQSRYIANVITEWFRPKWRSNARFYANAVSRRITDVGSVGLPDIYQERSMFLDFVYQFDIVENGKWSIRFSAENLADNNYRWTQAGILQRSFQLGRTYNVGTSFSIF